MEGKKNISTVPNLSEGHAWAPAEVQPMGFGCLRSEPGACVSLQGKSVPIPIIGAQGRWLQQAGSAIGLSPPILSPSSSEVGTGKCPHPCLCPSLSHFLWIWSTLAGGYPGLRAFSLLLLSAPPPWAWACKCEEHQPWSTLSQTGIDPVQGQVCKWAKSSVNLSCSLARNDTLIIFKVKNFFCS